jgi:hypothetical protein
MFATIQLHSYSSNSARNRQQALTTVWAVKADVAFAEAVASMPDWDDPGT